MRRQDESNFKRRLLLALLERAYITRLDAAQVWQLRRGAKGARAEMSIKPGTRVIIKNKNKKMNGRQGVVIRKEIHRNREYWRVDTGGSKYLFTADQLEEAK